MPWNATWPVGTQSVKANRPTGQQNTTYIKDTLGASIIGTNTVTTRDHFWDVGADQDGRHRFMQSPPFTVGGLPVDPVLGTSMGQVMYAKTKTAAESPDQQDVQPFARNGTNIMQMLAMRACVVFNIAPGTFAITIKYNHNVASVTRTGIGLYTITYTNALPSSSYFVLGGAVPGSVSIEQSVLVRGDATLTNVKSTALVKVNTPRTDADGALLDPIQAWVICFGG